MIICFVGSSKSNIINTNNTYIIVSMNDLRKIYDSVATFNTFL